MSTQHKQLIDLNLSDASRDTRNIGLNWTINIPPRKKSFLTKIFSTGDDIIRKDAVLIMEDLSYPEDLVLTGPLFSLVRGKEVLTDNLIKYDVTLQQLTTEFQIHINEKNIADYKVPHDTKPVEVPVSFRIFARDEKGDLMENTVCEVDLTLRLSTIECTPQIDIIGEPEVQYSSSKKECHIGTLSMASTADLQYPAPITVRGFVDATLNGKNARHLLLVKDAYGNAVADICTSQLKKGDTECYDIFLLMSEMENPLTDRDSLCVKFSGTYRVGETSIDNKHLGEVSESFDILQDSQGTECVVTHDGHRVNNSGEIRLKQKDFFALSSLRKEIRINIANIAKDTSRKKAGLKVFNLGISVELTPGVKLFDRDGNSMDPSGIFKVECPKPDILTSDGVFIPNGTNAAGECNNIDVQVYFTPKNISKVTGADDYHFTATVGLSFEYYENRYGDPEDSLQPGKFSMVIDQPLYLMPNTQWLCVDYGTSAIVCLFDNQIIDLRKRKTEIIKAAIKDRKLHTDNFEKGSKFLSSDIVFHNVDTRDLSERTSVPELATPPVLRSSLATEQNDDDVKAYNNLVVFLSPTSSMYTNETLRLLPCLKLLVGNEYLPKNTYIYNHKYYRNDKDGAVLVQAESDRDHPSSLLKVDQVFLQSYEALFRYFISSEVPNRDSINRLVLTYPNTYTPRHIATMRMVAKKAFPSLRMLEFVSESDAVAAYYLSHWSDYNRDDAQMNDSEGILVYDMGAGTLDISYVEKNQESDLKLTMQISGKLGTSKAGNYLDFVLALIVSRLTHMEATIATTKRSNDEADMKKRTELKLFVKTELKPMLKSENADKELVYNNEKFTIGDVLNHALFKKYLDACTDQILSQLLGYMNVPKLKVDTVLMSGRSCLLEPLQQRLRASIIRITDYTPNFVILDNPIRNADGNKDRQKTAVAEGAMEMADNYRHENSNIKVLSHRHYASFGIMFSQVGNKKVYYELLNHSQIPMLGDSLEFEGKPVTIKGLNNVKELRLVQTYLSAEDTEKALNDNNYELVTEMEVIDTQALGRPSQITVKLRIDSSNDIVMCLGDDTHTEGQQPRGEDLQSEDTKRSIWPVTI